MTAPSVDPVRTEARLGRALRRYERAKVALLVVILVIVSVSGAYLIGVARQNRRSLTILECAVARSTSFDESGHARSAADARVAFERCVKRH